LRSSSLKYDNANQNISLLRNPFDVLLQKLLVNDSLIRSILTETQQSYNPCMENVVV
jgi:hypothetical protein